MSEAKPKYRIWFQGATDRVHMAPYLARVEAHLQAILGPEFAFSLNATTPPATTTHALTEYRIGAAFVKSALEAGRQGYDAMAITHFQDAGLSEVKSVADFPVLGLGETTLFHACTLGRKLGLVTINPAFIPWHEDQIARYGLQSRVVGVRSMNAGVADYIDAFANQEAYAKIAAQWERECRVLLDAGADVIVPAGGLPMMLFGAPFGANIDGAPIVNGITLIAKAAETAIQLRQVAGMAAVSRRSNFARPPDKALDEFLHRM